MPIHDLLAERAVLGSMLMSREAAEMAAERLRPESFYKLAHQDIFEAACSVVSADKALDIVLLRDALRQKDRLDRAGGEAYIAQVMESVPTSANAEHYIAVVADCALKRTLAQLGEELKRGGADASVTAQELVAQAQGQLEHQDGQSKTKTIVGDLVEETVQFIEHWGDGTGIRTGLMSLDNALDCLPKGTLTIIGADARDGKTALSCNIALNVARQGQAVLIFSAEMPKHWLTANLLTIVSGVSWREFRRRSLSPSDYDAFLKAKHELAKLQVWIEDAPGIEVERLVMHGIRLVRRRKVALIIVDYVQLLRCALPGQRNVQVAFVSSELKRLARVADVPVLALSQITRDEQGRAHLRWAKELEQDADFVILMGRQSQHAWGSEDSEPDVAVRRLKVEKNRYGPEAAIEVEFVKPILTFREVRDGDGDPGTGQTHRGHGGDTAGSDKKSERTRQADLPIDTDVRGEDGEETAFIDDVPEDIIPF